MAVGRRWAWPALEEALEVLRLDAVERARVLDWHAGERRCRGGRPITCHTLGTNPPHTGWLFLDTVKPGGGAGWPRRRIATSRLRGAAGARARSGPTGRSRSRCGAGTTTRCVLRRSCPSRPPSAGRRRSACRLHLPGPAQTRPAGRPDSFAHARLRFGSVPPSGRTASVHRSGVPRTTARRART